MLVFKMTKIVADGVSAYFCAVEIATLYREIATGAKRPRNDTITLGHRTNQTKAKSGGLQGGASGMPRPTSVLFLPA